MLVYECKKKNPLRVVEAQEDQEAEEKVTSIPYNTGLEEKYIPEWLKEMIMKDNVDFVIDK
jgi:hypothetical protein